ncbi:hypothetical protein SLEP1_g4451 [Rubroshorea leprosula]|uniref:Uncharacterized protein n=1 Tax=Rubroshorea leprosula TaxID=152421 RepID=A0AAV5HZJ0_9ROSI|nr:hypothetical protein SLEP1_g4451 [Rubroshorea leprosula]
MLQIPFCKSSSIRRSITAFPSPIPWNDGSTTTSHIMALKTPSPVALANATGFWVLLYSTHSRESVCSSASLIFSGSRLGNPTATKTDESMFDFHPASFLLSFINNEVAVRFAKQLGYDGETMAFTQGKSFRDTEFTAKAPSSRVLDII